jgi:rSAM/selenodomain-associated transferase 2
MSKISIIIPILNEAKTIGILLQHLFKNSSVQNISEIIIVDGGSTDGSQDVVNHFVTSSDSETSSKLPRYSIKYMASAKGRAKQMNDGAKKASGDILYFLHSDSLPPKHFDERIINEVEKGNNIGCFRMKFDSDYFILKFSQWFTRFNFKFCRGGDQSLFITYGIFNELNGYNETFGVYEDCEFIGRIYKKYTFTIIDDYIITSARRYAQNGSWRLQYHFTIIHLKKWFGASPEQLYGYYKKYIS